MSTSESRRETQNVGNRELFAGESTCGWCQASTRRLLLKLAHHKPAGVARHFHLMCLVDLLNHVYEDESDVVFEDYLSAEHLAQLKCRRAATRKGAGAPAVVKYPPSYKIRPDAKQIEAKLDELYGMSVVDDNELIPDEMFSQTDYQLPAYVLAMEDFDAPAPPTSAQPPPSSSQPAPTTSSTTTRKPTANAPVRRGAPRAAAASQTTSAAAAPSLSTVSAAIPVPASASKRLAAAAAAKSSERGTTTTTQDAQIFSPPVKRATRTGVKRRAAPGGASQSISPRSSRSSTPASAKRER